MINKLLRILAPHYCYGCGQIGTVLCQNCKYDIVDEGFAGCVVCAGPAEDGICKRCETSYSRAWCVAERDGTVRKLIDAYKFERLIDAGPALAMTLDDYLPILPESTIVVPVPSLPSHIRQRGYDHTRLIAASLAHQRKLRFSTALLRTSTKAQRGLSKKERFAHAEQSYAVRMPVDQLATYLLIDDVITTNATVRACAGELRRAGVADVWVAALARQPLDK